MALDYKEQRMKGRRRDRVLYDQLWSHNRYWDGFERRNKEFSVWTSLWGLWSQPISFRYAIADLSQYKPLSIWSQDCVNKMYHCGLNRPQGKVAKSNCHLALSLSVFRLWHCTKEPQHAIMSVYLLTNITHLENGRKHPWQLQVRDISHLDVPIMFFSNKLLVKLPST